MKQKLIILIGAVLTCGASPSGWAQSEPVRLAPVVVRSSAEKPYDEFNFVLIKNLQDESLGRITDLGIDLGNGRIVEALVVCDPSLGVGKKIVAVPPLALQQDPSNKIYRLDVATAVFKAAPAIDLDKWLDSGRSERVAAAYRLFGQKPYFLEEGAAARKTAGEPNVPLGYVERLTRIMEMPVGSPKDDKFGNVWGLTMEIPKGRIRTVIILSPGNFETKTIVSPMALSFNASRDALLLGDSKAEYGNEPSYVFTKAAFGQKAYSYEEFYDGSRISSMPRQGGSEADMDMTIRIERNIRAEKIPDWNLQVGTMNGRVILRGWADTEDEKRRVGAIAIAAAHLEFVDNQIRVKTPLAGN